MVEVVLTARPEWQLVWPGRRALEAGVASAAKLDPGSRRAQDRGSKVALAAPSRREGTDVADQPEEVSRFLDAIKALEEIEDDAACAKAITDVLKDWPDSHAKLREIRQERILRMRAKEMTWQQIGDELGIHFTRAQQISKGLRGSKRPAKKAAPADEEGGSA